MRALAAALLTAFLVLFVVTKTTAAPLDQGGSSTASKCTWERHSKRVVKRVRRHGKIRKVVHRKHWWTCVPVTATSPATVPIPPPTTSPQPEPEPEANRLAVKAAEYYFVLSRPSVRAGEVTIELNNQGEDPHNLNLRLEGSGEEPQQIAETDSQQHTAATFDLPAGKYHLWCTLPQHEEKGMATNLIVE